MPTARHRAVATLGLALLTHPAAFAEPEATAVEVIVAVYLGGPPFVRETPLRVTLPPAEPLFLDVTQRPERVRVVPPAGSTRTYRVQMRFETILALEGDGKSLFLDDWQRYQSEWTELAATAAHEFAIPAWPEPLPFLAVSKEDVVRGVAATVEAALLDEESTLSADGARFYLERARSAAGPTSPPLSVVAPRMWLRLLASRDGDWQEIGVVEVELALSC